MANYRAVANGNWSNLATWEDDSGGSYAASTVLPSPTDIVYTNNFIVTVDISPTVLTLSNLASTNVNAGGKFIINDGQTLEALLSTFSNNNFVEPNTNSTSTFISPSITHGNTDSFTIVGSGKNLTVIGNISSNTSLGIYRPNGGILNVIGNISMTGGGYWVDMIVGGTINITGNLNTVNQGFWVRGACVINLLGSLTSGTSVAYLNTNQNVTFTHIGPVITGGNNAAIVDTFGIYAGTGPFLNNGDYNAVAASRFRLINTSPTSIRLTTSVTSINTFLYTEDNVGGVPPTGDVRDGVIFGINNGLIGTLDVPPPNTVLLGVPVDNTVGTLEPINATTFLSELSSSSDPLAERLRNVSTVDSTAATVAAFKV